MSQILVGSSMGGWLMLLAAIARPEKTKALVGISTATDHFVTAFKSLPLQVRNRNRMTNVNYGLTQHQENALYSEKGLCLGAGRFLISQSADFLICPPLLCSLTCITFILYRMTCFKEQAENPIQSFFIDRG